MIRRVLIPLDGSELAEQVIPHLLRFVSPMGTELLLMTASSSSIFPLLNDTIRSLTSEQIVLSNENVSKQVHAVAQQLNQIGFRVKSQFLSGTPAESILHLAEEAYVDLIAMSTHGRTGFGLVLLGSIAEEVVRNACPPVFLVPAQAVVKPDPLPRTILLPLDGTPLAETAIPTACQFAKNTGAVIHLVRIIEPHGGAEQSKKQPLSNHLDNSQPISQQAACYLERMRLRLQLAGVVTRCQVTEGIPADTIVRIAHAENADLIVMSTHGRTGMERLVYGSVVSQVIGNTICPLLLMRGKVPVEDWGRAVNAVPALPSSCKRLIASSKMNGWLMGASKDSKF